MKENNRPMKGRQTTRAAQPYLRSAFLRIVELVQPHLATIQSYNDWYHDDEDFADRLVDRAKNILIEEMGRGLSVTEREKQQLTFENTAMDIGREVVEDAIKYLSAIRMLIHGEDKRDHEKAARIAPVHEAQQLIVPLPYPLEEMLQHLDREHAMGIYRLPVAGGSTADPHDTLVVANSELNDLLRDIIRADWQRHDAICRGQTLPDADELCQRLYARLDSDEFSDEERGTAYRILD